MKQSTIRLPVAGMTAAFSVLGFFLRLWQWRYADAAGRLWLGSPGSIAVFAATGVFLFALILLCRRGPVEKNYNFPAGLSSGAGYLAGGALLTLVSVLSLVQQSVSIAGILGCVCGVVTVRHGLLRRKGKAPNLLASCLIVVYLVVLVISDFKNWSTDPALPDYCFKLLALLCAMLALFHVAGFSGGLGKRRTAAFWCAAGVYFCAICLADRGGLQPVLSWLAYAALLLQNLWCLLSGQTPEAGE